MTVPNLSLVDAARADLRERTTPELKALHISDRTGLVIEELTRRARCTMHGLWCGCPDTSYDAIIAQPNS